MNMPEPGRIFISYAVRDGSEAARGLRKKLEEVGFAIWQDVVALEGGRDWWSQIEEAIRAKSVEHLLLVVSPEALNRPVVRREIRLARTLGKQVTPVQSGPELDLSVLPRWLGHVLDPLKPEHWGQLIKTVSGPSQQKRMPMMAPEPPANFVARPKEFDALKMQLLDAKGDAVGITAALRGAGGYGKTTLAKALAHDVDIQEAFFDGVLWVELGENGTDRVVALISDLVTLITGTPPAIATREAAASALADALGDRRFLLIIDDVWQRAALEPFLNGGSSTTRLVTTRFDRELPEEAVRQPVDAMAQNEALTLLSTRLPIADAGACRVDLQELTSKLGEWAQLVLLVNGFLRDRVVKHRQSLLTAIKDVTRRLDAHGLAAFDDTRAKDYDERHRSIAAVIKTSLELLDTDQQARFHELGIFPEDADIPISIVARLWSKSGGLDEIATEDLLRDLYDLSLLLALDFEDRTFRFHDTTRHFLQDEAGKAKLEGQHSRLVRAIADMGGADDIDPASRRYFYEYLPDHLAGAGEREMLDELLFDPGWLQAKLNATRNSFALLQDYEKHGRGELQSDIGRTLRLIAGICRRDKRQLAPQLIGRLMPSALPGATAFLSKAQLLLEPEMLVPRSQSLTGPGPEQMRMIGHHLSVAALAVLQNGQVASGGSGKQDGTVRIWDTNSGIETASLKGHTGAILALVAMSDQYLASSGNDGTIRLWDVEKGVATACIESQIKNVSALAVLPDGRLASGGDGSIRLWGIDADGENICLRAEGGYGVVSAFAVLPDGRLASGMYDQIHIWDLNNYIETTCLKCGQMGNVAALAVLPDGRLASAGDIDKTIRIWDVDTGVEAAALEGHTAFVRALVALPDGRLASGGDDETIRIWDVNSGIEIACLAGHDGFVEALAVLSDGRLVSGGSDDTIRFWDIGNVAQRTEPMRLSGDIKALAMLKDRRIVASGHDYRILLSDVRTGKMVSDIANDWSNALAVLPDGRIASGPYWGDRIEIRHIGQEETTVWGPTANLVSSIASILKPSNYFTFSKRMHASEPMYLKIEGGNAAQILLAVLQDGRLASTHLTDEKIHVWDVRTGVETASILLPESGVKALTVLPNGRLASGSSAIRVWDVSTGRELAHMEVQDEEATKSVYALVALPDGRLVSGHLDGAVRIWDVDTSSEVSRFDGHTDSVMALAPLSGGRLASGGRDRTIRIWDVSDNGHERSRLDIDGQVHCLLGVNELVIAGDSLGGLHWLEIVD